MSRRIIQRLGIFGLIIVAVLVSCIFIKDEAYAQDPQNGTPVDFEGTVDYVDQTILVVDGVAIDISTVMPSGSLQIGMTVHVVGVEIQNNIVVAQQITIVIVVNVGTPTPSSTPSGSTTPTATATATGTGTQTVTATPTATGTPDGTVTPTAPGQLPIIIVVEGVVSYVDIEVNIVIINNVVIHVDDDDDDEDESDDDSEDVPIEAIHIGDWLRIEGESLGGDHIIVVIAVVIVFVDIDVFILDGEFFRDDSDCSNPPPPWAPANGWRRRCEGGNGSNNDDGMGMGDDD